LIGWIWMPWSARSRSLAAFAFAAVPLGMERCVRGTKVKAAARSGAAPCNLNRILLE
jgi:hypothetical protein